MEQDKIEHDTSKIPTPLNDTDPTHATLPPPKKRYEIMKDHVLLSSPIYPPFISSKPSLSTTRDDHLIPLLSHDDSSLKIFSLQFNFFRPSIYDLKTDESDPSFLSVSQKATHHQTYTKFLQYT